MRKAQEKIVTQENLVALLRGCKQRGQRIVLANGIFDDFVGQIPNISFAGNGRGNRLIILRGISTSSKTRLGIGACCNRWMASSPLLAVSTR